jgi:hypothetical protein
VEVWRLRKHEKLLAQYEERQRCSQIDEIVEAPPQQPQAEQVETTVEPPQVDQQTVVEKFVPSPDEWFYAKVVHTDQDRYLLLELSNGLTVYCPWQKVTQSLGKHSKCLRPGTECSVRMALDRQVYWALEMCIDDTAKYFETSKARIGTWNGLGGTAQRDCGCSIFVLCHSQIDPSTVHVGDQVEIQLRPSEKRGWVGFIQRFVYEEAA